ncbi:hypothetical protein ABEO51_07845 [Bacillus safensis]
MKNIDVYALAQKIDKEINEIYRKETEQFINSVNGKAMDASEILSEIVAPLIGMSNAKNREFTIDLIQKVVDELNSED